MLDHRTPLGFTAVPLKFKADSSAQHVLFIKQHIVRDKSSKKPSDRTLFIINVPPYCSKKSLQNAWKECGNVTSVFFHSRPHAGDPLVDGSSFFPCQDEIKGFKVAYVVFAKPSALQKALKWSSECPLILSTPDEPEVHGIQKWCKDYNLNIPNTDEMQKEIDEYMASYDRRVQTQIAKDIKAGEEDEEGWTTVTKRGRNPGFSRSEKVNRKLTAIEERKRSKKQLLNFYSFQVRESKMNNLVKLRQKFEEDKKKIQGLKQMRRFKPF